MKILLTNIVMSGRSGTEIVTAELAHELRKRGHEIVVYTNQCGKLGETMRFQGMVVVDKITNIPFVPDIIHGHHNVSLAIALAQFPQVPSLFVCHDFDAWHDRAFLHCMVHKYISIDQLCLKRLIMDGISKDECCIISNAVVMDKFVQKKEIKKIPEKALVLSKSSTHVNVIKETCEELNIKLDLLGSGFNKEVDNLYEILQDYDIVFATARMAMEALACGCCVIVCDHRGFAGTVTTQNWTNWYNWNLGRGILTKEISKENIINSIKEYSFTDIVELTRIVRVDSDINTSVAKYESIYEEIILNCQQNFLRKTSSLIPSEYNLASLLEDLLPSYDLNRTWFDISKKMGNAEVKNLERSLDPIKQNVNDIRHHVTVLQQDVNFIQQDTSIIKQDTDIIRQDIGFIRIITKILRVPYSKLKKIWRLFS